MLKKYKVTFQIIALSYCPNRGLYDDELHFMFRGTDEETLKKVFTKFCCGEYRLASDFEIIEEQDVKYINGHSTRRFAVKMIEPDFNFMNIDSMMILISALLKSTINCTVDIMDMDHFLNI